MCERHAIALRPEAAGQTSTLMAETAKNNRPSLLTYRRTTVWRLIRPATSRLATASVNSKAFVAVIFEEAKLAPSPGYSPMVPARPPSGRQIP
jgi:hypothetical protein